MKTILEETSPGSNVYKSSGNIFADIGLPDAEELDTKLRLGVAINRILDARALTQKDAAKLLAINQPKVSALRNYRLDGFSVARLIQFATALNHDVVIELKPRKRVGRVRVVNAA